MKLIYITLDNTEEARTIGHKLLEKKLANCVNYFPITTIYNCKGKVSEEGEVVLIVKTKEDRFDLIEEEVKKHIDYENFIGLIDVKKVNQEFKTWLGSVVE